MLTHLNKCLFNDAVVWLSNHEECALPIGIFGAGLLQGINMGLLSRSSGYSYCVHCDGCFWQFTHHLPSLDIINRFPSLSVLCGTDLCSGFCFWLVLDFPNC